MIEYLIRHLPRHHTLAVLSRGYGRTTRGFMWVEPHLSAAHTGDEPLQIKTKFTDVAVAVCESRVDGVRRILTDKPNTTLILLDDAYQHRAITPHINILLSSYSLPYFSDWLLPLGRLRESRQGAKRAHAIIYTKCPPNYIALPSENKPTFYSQIVCDTPVIDGPVFGFSGLAVNRVFENHLAAQYDLKGFRNYADHYAYTAQDIQQLVTQAAGATLVCTEKDWIKLKEHPASQHIRHINIHITVTGDIDFIQWLTQQIS
jgi:tetraacyldisaccharide 4'-kinase